jgi:hypothetical protein
MAVQALIRSGARGAGQYTAIGMEEALRTATMWLSMIRHDQPDELTICVGKHNDFVLAADWAQKFGTRNLFSDRLLSAANAPRPRHNNQRTTLVLAFGSGTGQGALATQQQLAKLRKDGAKIISVNPVKLGLSALADQWISITPGTDEALLHVLMQIMANQELDVALLAHSGISPSIANALADDLKAHRGSTTILAGRGVFAHRYGSFVSALFEQLEADILPAADHFYLPDTIGGSWRNGQAILTVGAHLPWKAQRNDIMLKDFSARYEGHIIALSDQPESYQTCADLVFCGKAEENLVQLAARLGLEQFSDADGKSPYQNGYDDYVGQGVAIPQTARPAAIRQQPADSRLKDGEKVWGLSEHFPFRAISQKPRSDSNRAIVFMNTRKARQLGLAAKDRVIISSEASQVPALLATMDDMDPRTLWSWGSSLFSKIADPGADDAATGQPAWFDLCVRVEKAE